MRLCYLVIYFFIFSLRIEADIYQYLYSKNGRQLIFDFLQFTHYEKQFLSEQFSYIDEFNEKNKMIVVDAKVWGKDARILSLGQISSEDVLKITSELLKQTGELHARMHFNYCVLPESLFELGLVGSLQNGKNQSDEMIAKINSLKNKTNLTNLEKNCLENQ